MAFHLDELDQALQDAFDTNFPSSALSTSPKPPPIPSNPSSKGDVLRRELMLAKNNLQELIEERNSIETTLKARREAERSLQLKLERQRATINSLKLRATQLEQEAKEIKAREKEETMQLEKMVTQAEEALKQVIARTNTANEGIKAHSAELAHLEDALQHDTRDALRQQLSGARAKVQEIVTSMNKTSTNTETMLKALVEQEFSNLKSVVAGLNELSTNIGSSY